MFDQSLVLNMMAFAQEKGAEVNADINKSEGSAWYASPWVWRIGAAILILLLVALARGRNRAD